MQSGGSSRSPCCTSQVCRSCVVFNAFFLQWLDIGKRQMLSCMFCLAILTLLQRSSQSISVQKRSSRISVQSYGWNVLPFPSRPGLHTRHLLFGQRPLAHYLTGQTTSSHMALPRRIIALLHLPFPSGCFLGQRFTITKNPCLALENLLPFPPSAACWLPNSLLPE